jgi:hypothetical protein
VDIEEGEADRGVTMADGVGIEVVVDEVVEGDGVEGGVLEIVFER